MDVSTLVDVEWYLDIYYVVNYVNMKDKVYTYEKHVTEVERPYFGLDRNGQVTYEESECVGHPHLYECVNFMRGKDELQRLFDSGYTLFIMKGYYARGAAIKMDSRARVIEKFGFASPSEIDRMVIHNLNAGIKNKKEIQ
jgi:hypothetical protein